MIRFLWEKYLRDSENVNVKQDTQYVCKTKCQASARYKTVQALLFAQKSLKKKVSHDNETGDRQIGAYACHALQANQKQTFL